MKRKKIKKIKKMYIQLRPKDMEVFRSEQWSKQKGKCPVLKKPIKLWDSVIDHKHKLKAQKPGPKGRGLVRGLLDYRVNAFEGYVTKKYKRVGLHNEIGLPELLRNLADYLENPPCPQKYIHPAEKPKAPFLMKSDYNKIVKWYLKVYPRARKIPEYPKSGIKYNKKGEQQYKYRITAKWERILEDLKNYLGRK